jgi:hypothetical protein
MHLGLMAFSLVTAPSAAEQDRAISDHPLVPAHCSITCREYTTCRRVNDRVPLRTSARHTSVDQTDARYAE